MVSTGLGLNSNSIAAFRILIPDGGRRYDDLVSSRKVREFLVDVPHTLKPGLSQDDKELI